MKAVKLWPPIMLALWAIYLAPVEAGEITPAGRQLTQSLDAMHVEELWLPGKRVDWRTGQSSGKDYATPKGHTHCSAFAAAAAERLGVYLLHPPEHSANLLANAQQDWLNTNGAAQGWSPVSSPKHAQELANEGQLVVVTCKNPNPKSPGHIAVVRPSAKEDSKIDEEGPDIIQAGAHNYTSTSVKEGFKNHPGAFENKELQYFSHALPPPPAEASTKSL